MRPSRRSFLIILSILLIGQRAPAPIVESTEKPTLATEERPSKPKHSAKPKSSPEQSEIPETKPTRNAGTRSSSAPARNRFAGNWVGTMPTVPWGNLPSVVTIDSSGTAMAMSWYEGDGPANGKIFQHFKAAPETARAHPGTAYARAQRSGDTFVASFPAPLLGKSMWSLTPQPDGMTANVRMQAFMNDFTAVFRKSP